MVTVALVGLWIFSGFFHPTFERFTRTKAIGVALHPGTIKFGIYDHFQVGWCGTFDSRLSFSPPIGADPFSTQTPEPKALLGTLFGSLGFDSHAGSAFLISIPFWILTLVVAGVALAISKSSRRWHPETRSEVIDLPD